MRLDKILLESFERVIFPLTLVIPMPEVVGVTDVVVSGVTGLVVGTLTSFKPPSLLVICGGKHQRKIRNHKNSFHFTAPLNDN
jgi:hypothetical protein